MYSSDEILSAGVKMLVVGGLCLVGLGWCGAAVVKPLIWPAEQAVSVAQQTFHADNVIYNYEWFHTRYAEWQTAGTNAETKERELQRFLVLAGPANTWSVGVQREVSQLRVELSGLQAQRVSIANEYNSHVAMANRDLFRSRSLPEHLGN